MRIVSTFLPPEPSDLVEGRPTIVFAFDTLVDQKGLVVGITVGSLNGPDIDQVRVSAVGQTVIDRVGQHMARNYPEGLAIVAGVAQVAGAKERVRKLLTQAPPGSLLLLVCANDKVYDAATPALGIQFESANQRSQ